MGGHEQVPMTDRRDGLFTFMKHKIKLRFRLKQRLRSWCKYNGNSIKALCITLPRYLSGNLHPFGRPQKPSHPQIVFGDLQWISVEKWNFPSLEVSIMDGMGEHYGYPRHRAYVVFWWKCRGYAWGIEYSTKFTSIIKSKKKP